MFEGRHSRACQAEQGRQGTRRTHAGHRAHAGHTQGRSRAHPYPTRPNQVTNEKRRTRSAAERNAPPKGNAPLEGGAQKEMHRHRPGPTNRREQANPTTGRRKRIKSRPKEHAIHSKKKTTGSTARRRPRDQQQEEGHAINSKKKTTRSTARRGPTTTTRTTRTTRTTSEDEDDEDDEITNPPEKRPSNEPEQSQPKTTEHGSFSRFGHGGSDWLPGMRRSGTEGEISA